MTARRPLPAALILNTVRMSDGLTALNTTVELTRDLGRPRGGVRRFAGRELIGVGAHVSSDLFRPSVAGYERTADALAPTVVAALRTTQQAGVIS